MKKRRKLFHFNDLLKNKINFYDMIPVTNGSQKGTRYMLSDPLTDEQKTLLSKYDNVIISSGCWIYSPEQVKECIILLR